MNDDPGFRASRNWGSMCSAEATAYDTWLMSPNQDYMSVMLVGLGKLQMASR